MCNHDTDTGDEGARPASRPISSSDVGDDVPPGVSSSGAPMTIEAPAAIAIPSSSGPMRPRLALLPAPPTVAVAASAGTGELGWSTSYSRGRGRGRGRGRAYWRGRGGWSRGGGSYGGDRGSNRGPRGRGRGRGWSLWGRPAPYPTSVVCICIIL